MKKIINKIFGLFGYIIINKQHFNELNFRANEMSRSFLKVQKLNSEIVETNTKLLDINKELLQQVNTIAFKNDHCNNLTSKAIDVALKLHSAYAGELIAFHNYSEEDIKNVLGDELYNFINN